MKFLNATNDHIEEISFEFKDVFKIVFMDYGKTIKICNSNSEEFSLSREDYLKLLYEMSELLFEVKNA